MVFGGLVLPNDHERQLCRKERSHETEFSLLLSDLGCHLIAESPQEPPVALSLVDEAVAEQAVRAEGLLP